MAEMVRRAHRSSNPFTIFIVDDDGAVRRALARLLRAEGFNVETFASGPEFLASVGAERRGCVLLDLRMPGLSGFEVLDRLEARGRPLPVILITGDDDPQMTERARQAGCADLLAKPLQDLALIAAVRSALRTQTGRGDG